MQFTANIPFNKMPTHAATHTIDQFQGRVRRHQRFFTLFRNSQYLRETYSNGCVQCVQSVDMQHRKTGQLISLTNYTHFCRRLIIQ